MKQFEISTFGNVGQPQFIMFSSKPVSVRR